MPISGGKYVAPTWVNSTSPPIDADELQDICDSIEAYADPASVVPTIPNPNLLDNWYFVGGGSQQGGGQFPINSNGQTSYSGNAIKTVDRWVTAASGHTIGLVSTGLKVTVSSSASMNYVLKQIVANLDAGRTYTISALIVENTTTSGVVVRIGDYVSEKLTGTGVITYTGIHADNVGFGIYNRANDNGNYFVVAAIKLELGDTQTLAHQENGVWVLNEIPNYDIQFARCSELPSVPARYEYGTYVGTGTVGSSNPNTLTFGFKPKYVMVTGTNSSGTVSAQFVSGMTTVSTRSSTAYTYNATWGDNSLSWYYNTTATSYAWRQMNASGVTYYYTAIG